MGDMITQEQFEQLVQALMAIPAESLVVIQDLPPALPVSFVHAVQERLRKECGLLRADLRDADLRVSALLHLRGVDHG
jgi:hypothetical protein